LDKVVALPTDVTSPVKLALVVTLPAVRPAAVPVMFVPTRAVGVPSAGVTIVVPVNVPPETIGLVSRGSAVPDMPVEPSKIKLMSIP